MDDRLRPRYHFTPAANWMNDPNGLIQWKGPYHLFYQHNPNGAFWGDMHWGHATSRDLVSWSHQPIALVPDVDGVDRDGCFSGVAVVDGDRVAFVYTGVRGDAQLPCLAFADDDELTTWKKYPGNPVIASPPGDIETTIFRDHSVWRDGDSWFQVIGSGIDGVGGAALLYWSPDLVEWEYLGPLVVEDRDRIASEWKTTGWECPDFFRLRDRHVLTFSLWDDDPLAVGYFSGRYADFRFVPDAYGLVDAGESFYAPQSFFDESGRRIMIGWLREECSGDMQLAHGWSGAMSIPRVLDVDGDGGLEQTPVPELEALRRNHVHLELEACDWFRRTDMGAIDANYMEFDSEWEWGSDGMIGFNLVSSETELERTVVCLSVRDDELVVDTTESSVNPGAPGGVHRALLGLVPGEPIRVRLFVDASVIEVFVNKLTCLVARMYPTELDSGTLHVSSTIPGRIDVWEMATT